MTMKHWVGIGALFIVVCVAGFMVSASLFRDGAAVVTPQQVTDYKNATYTISGSSVTLNNGVATVPVAPGSEHVQKTTYFGNDLVIDLNSDGREDHVFLLTEEGGGSGVFFYLVAALNTEAGFVGSAGALLGDRIAPQSITRGGNNSVVVNYAERELDEPMTAAPSLGVTKRFVFDVKNNQFGEVVEDFEGEADPLLMSLSMKTWVWQETNLNDGSVVTPKQADAFTLTFAADGTFAATTDCNGVGGQYAANGPQLTFSEIMSTEMFCEGSQEADFVGYLSNSSGYHFTTKGELILDLKFDSGTVILR